MIKGFFNTQIIKYPYIFDKYRRLKRILGSSNPFYSYLDKFSKIHNKKINFLQIGSNDGLVNDNIREFIVRDHWSGILVEPQPVVFRKLKSNYSKVRDLSRLTFLNVAVSNRMEDSANFWTIDESFANTLPIYKSSSIRRKASFVTPDYLRLACQANGVSEDHIVKIKVPVLTIKKILEDYWQWSNLDLLIVDAEGNDSKIILSIDFSNINPEIIIYETPISNSESEKLSNFLVQNNYRLESLYDPRGVSNNDTIAIKNGSAMENSL